MIRLNEQEDREIRNWLDEMGGRLYHDVVCQKMLIEHIRQLKNSCSTFMLYKDLRTRKRGKWMEKMDNLLLLILAISQSESSE